MGRKGHKGAERTIYAAEDDSKPSNKRIKIQSPSTEIKLGRKGRPKWSFERGALQRKGQSPLPFKKP